ncbi:MAG: ABC transporter permease subunit [Myxococcales bacterium]|nr:ABC transporter permease subunit [Myxococcales bacterium]
MSKKAADTPARVGPPAAPGFGHSFAVVFRTQIRRLVRGRKLRLGLISTALVLFAVVAARYASQRDVGAERARELAAEAVENGFSWGFFKLLVFLLPFLFTSGAIAEEVESRTFAYVASRPVSRPALALGKWAAGATLTVALLVGSGLVMHLASLATDPATLVDAFPSTLKTLGALALLGICYSAICMLWGSMVPEAAGIVSALYLGIVEWLLSFGPGSIRWVSMNYVGRRLAGLEPGGILPEIAPEVDPLLGVGLISGLTVVFLLFSVLVVQLSEYRFGHA